MKVVVGAPVAERAWILPEWFRCVGQQTLQPEVFCFVYSKSQDATRARLKPVSQPSRPVFVKESKLPFFSRDERNSDPKDPWRAKHMAKLRNELLTWFLQTDGDYFVSLDTDVLLRDPYIIAELINTLTTTEYDVVQPVVYLHSAGKLSKCYNAGLFNPGDRGEFDEPWRRVDENEWVSYGNGKLMKIDIPMAAVAMRRHVAAMCHYRAHECGEDIGFAQSVRQHGFKVGWRTDLECEHVWEPRHLEAPALIS